MENGENIDKGAFLDIGSGGRNTAQGHGALNFLSSHSRSWFQLCLQNQESRIHVHIPAQVGKFLCVDGNLQV